MRRLTIGDRTISFNDEANQIENTGTTLDFPFEKIFLKQEEFLEIASYSEADSGAGSECSEDHEDVDTGRKLIMPDMMAISQLLNFDEEEEDDLSESEMDENYCETSASDVKWKHAIVKDLVSMKTNDKKLERRHSISQCELETTKHAEESGTNSPTYSSITTVPSSPSRKIDATTLNLNLSDVKHIRSVLVRAELEALSLCETVKQSIEQGKTCMVCTSTRFGMFRRGEKCEVCQQTVCYKCFSKIRIQAEQFSAIPVRVLSPTTSNNESSLGPNCLSSKYLKNISNCAGSAPSSPQLKKKDSSETLTSSTILNEQLQSLPNISSSPLPSLSPPLVTSNNFTLPRNKMDGRRWSMISSREKLEGPLFTVCTACSDIVKQVIRSQGERNRT